MGSDSKSTDADSGVVLATPQSARTLLELSPVIAVLTVPSAHLAEPLVRALVAGGVRVVEITLRTEAALAAISAARRVDGVIVGAGTVLSVEQLREAESAGATFAVSPGSTVGLLEAGRGGGMPLLPGVSTASELMTGLELGYDAFKFFPAEAAGGARALRALTGPFRDVVWCPTGGITLAGAADYFAIPSVRTVGGSWLAPEELILAEAWDQIEVRARQTVEKLGGCRSGEAG